MITASHNPSRWNGIKYKASYGSSALPSIVAQIEKELAIVLANGLPSLPPRKELIQPLEPRAPYLDTVEKLVDWERIRKAKFRFVADPMYGSAAGFCMNCSRGTAWSVTKFAARATPISAAFIRSRSSRTSTRFARRC